MPTPRSKDEPSTPTSDLWAALYFAAQAMEVEPDEARIVEWVRRQLCPLLNETYRAVQDSQGITR